MDQELEARDSGTEPNGMFQSALSAVTKFGCLGLAAAIVIGALIGSLGSLFPKTVAIDQKINPCSVHVPIGYRVEKYRWPTNGFRVHIWAESRVSMFSMTFDVPKLKLVRVKTHRWVTNDRAILLELDYVHPDSAVRPGEVALLYDFVRGELHSFSSTDAWLVWQPERPHSRKSTREEFDRALQELSTAERSDPKVIGHSESAIPKRTVIRNLRTDGIYSSPEAERMHSAAPVWLDQNDNPPKQIVIRR
jgi:hypothetical protein